MHAQRAARALHGFTRPSTSWPLPRCPRRAQRAPVWPPPPSLHCMNDSAVHAVSPGVSGLATIFPPTHAPCHPSSTRRRASGRVGRRVQRCMAMRARTGNPSSMSCSTNARGGCAYPAPGSAQYSCQQARIQRSGRAVASMREHQPVARDLHTLARSPVLHISPWWSRTAPPCCPGKSGSHHPERRWTEAAPNGNGQKGA